MNKIIVDKEINKILDDSVIANDLVFDIVKDTTIQLDIKDNKKELTFNIKEDVQVNIIFNDIASKDTKYIFNLDKNSYLNVLKYNDTNDCKEKFLISLNGIYAKVDYMLKTISNNSQNYEIVIKHNACYTNSNITCNGVNIEDGNLVFTVSSYIPKYIKGCIANQNNRIVNLTNNKCIINPNLFIDENDVIANHSAYLGRFSDDELFYIESRGIDSIKAQSLLIKGFLLNNVIDDNIKELILNKIDEIWG